jgi:NADPH:quinone reductase-like Zn-dependent oxidoreductase
MLDPKPGAGDLVVRVAGIGINSEDMVERNGDGMDRYRWAGRRFKKQRRLCAGGLSPIE